MRRIYPSLRKRIARATWTGNHKVVTYRGLHLLLSCEKAPDHRVALHGNHEPEQFAYFFSNFAEGCDVFLDIGANIGLYALYAARLGGKAEIHAFEPDPRNFAQLMGNIYLNRFTGRVRAHDIALSDKSGMIGFDLAPELRTSLTKVAEAASPAAAQIMAKPLDEVLSYRGKRIFLKIDVEGHETAVLKGAARLLGDNDCFLQVESWPEKAEELSRLMGTAGYAQVRRIQNDYYFEKRAGSA